MRFAPRKSASGRIRAAIENLESRQLLTAYLVDSDVALAAINSKSLVAGDVVLFKGGATFTGNLQFGADDIGTADNPIVVGSYDPATGQQLTDSAAATARATLRAGSGKGINAYNTGGLRITGLNIVGSGTGSNNTAGIQFYNDLSGGRKLTGVSIDHVDVSGFGDAGILIGAWNGTSGYAGVRVTHVDVHHNGRFGLFVYGQAGSVASGYSNRDVYIGYSKFHDNYGIAGLSNHSGNGLIVSGVDGAVVEFSEAYYNGVNNTSAAGPFGIWAYEANNVLFQYNEAHHNRTSGSADGGGFDFDGGVTNSVMQFNYSHHNDGAGYGLYQYAGAPTWNNNKVINNVSLDDGQRNGRAGIEVWTAGPAMSNALIQDNQVIKSNANFLYIQNSSLVTGIQTVGNVFATSDTPNLAGIGLSGPAATVQPVPVVTSPEPETKSGSTTETSSSTETATTTTTTTTTTSGTTTTETTRKKRGRHARR